MTLQHLIDDKARVVVISGVGETNLEAATESVGRLLRDASRLARYGLLILVDPNAPLPADGEIHLMGDLLRVAMGALQGPAAIVASGDTHLLPGSLIALAAGGGSRPAECFQDEPSARAWLAVQLGT